MWPRCHHHSGSWSEHPSGVVDALLILAPGRGTSSSQTGQPNVLEESKFASNSPLPPVALSDYRCPRSRLRPTANMKHCAPGEGRGQLALSTFRGCATVSKLFFSHTQICHGASLCFETTFKGMPGKESRVSNQFWI